MLTADQLDSLSDDIIALYQEFEILVIRDIARRLAKMVIPSAAWQTQRLIESGSVYENVLKELARLTGKSETELRQIFEEAGVKTLRFDDAIYKAAGLKPLPFSPAMTDTLLAGLRKTNGVLKNLTLTTAVSSQQAFIHAADLAHLQVITGTMGYNSAIRQAIKSVGESGLEVIYPTGHRDKLDVATRRTVLTGVAQTAGNLQITRADEMGQDLVQVSAHVGARNKRDEPENHEMWQGKIYSRSGTHPKYGNFVEHTGYGTGEGLMGWNCRHSFYPFFEGLSQSAYSSKELREFADKTVKYNGQVLSMYDASQIQREIERKIRFWKRQASALDAAKLDSTLENSKISRWQARMRDFVSQTDLQRQRVREQM